MSGIEGAEREDFDDGEAGVGAESRPWKGRSSEALPNPSEGWDRGIPRLAKDARHGAPGDPLNKPTYKTKIVGILFLLTGSRGELILRARCFASGVSMFRRNLASLFLVRLFVTVTLVAGFLLGAGVVSAQVTGGGRRDVSSAHFSPTPSDRKTAVPANAIGDAACSPAPCALPNVQVSVDPATSPVIAASLGKATHLLAAAASSDCSGAITAASSDGGSAWDDPACLSGVGSVGDASVAYGNSAEYVVGTDGSSTGSAVNFQFSNNNGSSWHPEVEAVGPIFDDGDGMTNIPSVQVDNSSSSPYENAIYVSVTQFDDAVVESEITVSHSTNGGKTWTTTTVDPVQYKPEVDQYSRLAIGLDGTVYVAWQRCAMTGPDVNCAYTVADMMISQSSDGGNTWSTPVQIAAVMLAPETCGCNAFFGNLPNSNEPVANIPVLAIDNSTGEHAGNLYAVMYNLTGQGQMRVQVVTSSDGGNTWGKAVFVAPAEETHDQFFPTIAVSSEGVVGVGWLDRRNDPLNVSYQPFAATSSSGGAAFGTNIALATNLSDPYLDGRGGDYMGDYIGATWAASQFLVTWPDTRSMEFMQDYFGGLLVK
jgi:hypothetical protein